MNQIFKDKIPVRILSSDLLVADIITDIEGNEELQKLLSECNLKPGGKKPITFEQFQKFSQAIEGHSVKIVPGGSAANTLVTMSKLLPGQVAVDFLGVVGNSVYSRMIRSSLEDAGIRLSSGNLDKEAPSPQAAVSFVITYPDGERTIVTYPGNAKEFFTPDNIPEDMVKNSDVIFALGSIWQKFDKGATEKKEIFADRLLTLRWKHHKQLWLSLPTGAEFGEESAGRFRYLIPSANVVLSNIEELERIFKLPSGSQEQALKSLQGLLQETVLPKHGFDEQPVAFITLGKEGAAIVKAGHIEYIQPAKVDPKAIKNTLGAGDTAFAGFLAGHLKGLDNTASAKMAMELAGAKICEEHGPRLKNPQATLQRVLPHLADQMYRGDDSVGLQLSNV